jgi:hypothetical protein
MTASLGVTQLKHCGSWKRAAVLRGLHGNRVLAIVSSRYQVTTSNRLGSLGVCWNELQIVDISDSFIVICYYVLQVVSK